MSQQYLQTQDIVLAATLKVHGYKLERIEKEGNRGSFCFADVDDAEIQAYDLGQQTVEPVSFNNAIKALTTAARRVF